MMVYYNNINNPNAINNNHQNNDNNNYPNGSPNSNGNFNGNHHMHPTWYPGAPYHPQPGQIHQNGQLHPANVPPNYLPADEAQFWHHQHSVFHNEFPDFVHARIPQLQQHIDHPATLTTSIQNQMPSPTNTVVCSELSSPGTNGTNSPPQQLSIHQGVHPGTHPRRSPFEWIKKSSYQSQPNPGKTRTKDKYRVVYSDHQRMELEKEFNLISKYITIRRKAELAAALGLSERQVKIWFQNRRAKERKQIKKDVEEKNKIVLYNSMNGGPVLNTVVHQ